MANYTYTFNEALNAVLNQGDFARGSDFKDGFYLRKNQFGELILVDSGSHGLSHDLKITKGVFSQKYMVTQIATYKEMSKKD